jgi:hypothetical protein
MLKGKILKTRQEEQKSVSIRAKCFPWFEFIDGHVAPKLQNQILGENVSLKLFEVAKNFVNRDH